MPIDGIERPGPDRTPRSGERGLALLTVMILTFVLTMLGGTLLVMTASETGIVANVAARSESDWAASAMAEAVAAELGRLPDWTIVLAGGIVSAHDDGAGQPVLATGEPLDLAVLTRALQAATPARWASDTPAWRLIAHEAIDGLGPPVPGVSPVYVLAWVADDPADGDGNPAIDTNGRIVIRAEAFGPGRARRAVEVALARGPHPFGVRLRWWSPF